MNERDDLERRLTAFGKTATPPPSEELIERVRAERLTAPPAERPRRVVRLPVLLPATAVAALVLGLVLVLTSSDDGSGPTTFVVQSASDAVVEQSGQITDARAGQALSEGSEIRTGASGSVTIGDVTLGPAERAVVRGGRVRRIERRAELASAPVAIDLAVRRGVAGQVALRWSRYERDDFGAYVIIRDGRVVTARRNVERQIVIDRTRAGRTSRYVVVVLDRHRQIVGRSQIVMG